jgi:hypothetical protein
LHQPLNEGGLPLHHDLPGAFQCLEERLQHVGLIVEALSQ